MSDINNNNQLNQNNSNDADDKDKDKNNQIQNAVINGIKKVSIVDEMKKSYIDYAMSVIVARALPDVRDGLKPVQRRILYSMYKEGILPSSKYSKSMGVVGEVLKKYHPHGDAAVYEALARLVQDWTMRYPLIDGQGNFGSVDGDSPAAARYTECRLEKISMKLMDQIEKGTVDLIPNYSGEYSEPVVLPSVVPNLLINGSSGIAVGMATQIPPHNLGEVIDAVEKLIRAGNANESSSTFSYSQYAAKDYFEAEGFDLKSKHIKYPRFSSKVPTSELLQIIKGPDFPTYGEIVVTSQLVESYEKGRGSVLLRGLTEIEETNKGKLQIIIKELPYQVNKANLAEKIYNLLKDGKLDNISDIRDESTKGNIRLVIELKKGANAQIILNKIYKLTELQTNFNFNLLAIVDGRPQTLSLTRLLEEFIRHRYEVTIRSKIFELNGNIQRIHILEGYKIALDNIDEIINLIRSSQSAETAKTALIDRFGFSDVQAQAILDMQLRRLANLERKKIEDEYNEVARNIETLTGILDSREKVEEIILSELKEVKQKFADKRKTRIIKQGKDTNFGDFNPDDLIEKENIIITISKTGYIKRINSKEFKIQSRGGKGSVGAKTKTGDQIDHILFCTTHSVVLFFSNLGKVYALKAYEIPEFAKKSKGIPIVNILSFSQGEYVTSLLTKDYASNQIKVLDEDELQEGEETLESEGANYKFLFMATKFGTVKKTALESYDEIRRNGLITINLAKGDELLFVRPSTGESDVLILSRKGRTVRFTEKKVRELGRSSKGMRGIKLAEGDEVIMMDIVRKKEDRLIVVSEKGFGKLSELSQFPQKGRGTKGMLGYKITPKTGLISVARIIDHPDREILLITEKGQTIRMDIKKIRVLGRVTSGVRLMRVGEDDKVSAMALI